MSIFVNPAQFAPHEDLATYPRTLPRDLEILTAESLSVSGDSTIRTASAVFLPSVREMYPSGIDQNVAAQKGTFLEVKGYGEQMEGKSRPTFFRGVATVVTKLFNAIEVRSVRVNYIRSNHSFFTPAQQCILRPKRHPAMPHPQAPLSGSTSVPSGPCPRPYRPYRARSNGQSRSLLPQCVPLRGRTKNRTDALQSAQGCRTGVERWAAEGTLHSAGDGHCSQCRYVGERIGFGGTVGLHRV